MWSARGKTPGGVLVWRPSSSCFPWHMEGTSWGSGVSVSGGDSSEWVSLWGYLRGECAWRGPFTARRLACLQQSDRGDSKGVEGEGTHRWGWAGPAGWGGPKGHWEETGVPGGCCSGEALRCGRDTWLWGEAGTSGQALQETLQDSGVLGASRSTWVLDGRNEPCPVLPPTTACPDGRERSLL